MLEVPLSNVEFRLCDRRGWQRESRSRDAFFVGMIGGNANPIA